ncbi:MAG TPA: hypothetical protein PLY34_05750 [Ferruginibacter sp.]|jgi:hypothetical protein|nr:hypothetical protein [Ferruginibacter sp.]HPH91020.1 hypothetical protein [Ferruginibacter sp.]
MKKRSAILLLVLMVISFGLLLFTTYSTAAIPAGEKPAKCDAGPCNKKMPSAMPWNIISPTMFYNQG